MLLVPFYSETRVAYERPLAGRQMFRDHQQQFMQRGRKRKPIEAGLPGADSQTGLQRVAASASEKKKNDELSSAGCERSRPWLCSMLIFLFCYKALYFAQWWCKYKIQSLELLPNLPCLERENPITQQCSFSLCSFQVHPCKGTALS